MPNTTTKAAMAKKIACLKLGEIAKQFQDDIKLQDREYRTKAYENTFLGVEAIDLIERILLSWEECLPGNSNGGHSMATIMYPEEEEEESYRKLATIVAQKIQARYGLFYRAGREKAEGANSSSNDNHVTTSPIVDEYYIYVLTPMQSIESSLDHTTAAIKEEDGEDEEDEKESKEEDRPDAGTQDDDFNDKDFFEKLFRGQLDVLEDDSGGDDFFDSYIALPEKPEIVEEDIDIRYVASILEGSVHIKTNRFNDVEFPNTFVGSDAVDVLVNYGMAVDRVAAAKLGRALATDHNLFHHCPTTTASEGDRAGNDESSSQHQSFNDNFYFYRFTEKSERIGLEPKQMNDAMSVESSIDGDDYDFADYDLPMIAQELKQNVVVKDHKRHLKTYRKSFVASQAVSFLVDKGYANNRIDAVRLGRQLSEESMLFGKESVPFRDDDVFCSFESAKSGEEDESDVSDPTEIKVTREWSKSFEKISGRMNQLELKRQDTLGNVGKGLRWLRSFRRIDPRYRILTHFRTVSQLGEEKPDLQNMNPLLKMWYLSRNRNVFTVWRECKNDAIRKMMCGEAVGKGLDIKGKSAKQGKNAGYVPFLQIGVNKHKKAIDTLSHTKTVRVFFCPSAEERVREALVKHCSKMVARVDRAKQKISKIQSKGKDNISVEDQEELKDAKEVLKDWDMADPSINIIDAYKPDCIGFEVPMRLFWSMFFVEGVDITRVPGSEYDTQRPSMPKSQDDNNKAICSKSEEGRPRPVVWQADDKNPFNPQEFLMAYEERGRVLPVASDFDAFLFGTRRFRFDPEEDNLPPKQLEMLHWSVDQIGAILDIPPRPGSWTKRWQENYVRYRCSKNPGPIHYPPKPFGYADQKTKRMVEAAVEELSVDGSVRHGAESFNYFVPQEMEQKFLVVSDCRGTDCMSGQPWYFRTVKEEMKTDGDDKRGLVPWRYMNEQELIQFLSDKIDQGFTFPLSPKWILCDPGWKKLYDKLLGSTNEEVINSMKIWFPDEVRRKIDDIASRHPSGFEGGVLKTQEEVQKYFKPILKGDNWVFRKSALGYVRRAAKGEKVVTTINGTLETEQIVSNDTSFVGFNAAGSSHHVLSREEFSDSYDVTTLKTIDIHDTSLTHAIATRLVKEGYQVCKSKRAVYAHEVTRGDIDWFRGGIPAKAGKDERASYFVAPWGEFTRVEIGDVLVMPYPDGNDEIYRIEHYTFRGTYSPFNDNKRRLMSSVSIKGLGSSARGHINGSSKRGSSMGSSMSSKSSATSSTSGFEGQMQRSQVEVRERFLPLLRNDGGIFSKPASSTAYARRGIKGEKVVTDIAGKQETQNEVEDDTSWVVCGQSGEFYVVNDSVFQTRYNTGSARPLNPETDSGLPMKVLKEKFQEYNLCAVPMYARKVTLDDLIWFNHGNFEEFSYFEAPWKEPLRVEEGDMLVTQYHEGNDEVYRVEKIAFECSYTVHDGQL